MAIITKGGTPSKGSATSFTLNITDLLANSLVSNDAYFSIQSNWSKVFLNYKSDVGNQKESVIFKAVDSGTSDVADFSVFSGARDVFEIDSIVILDKQGGTLKIPRASLNEADFDVAFSVSVGQSYRYFRMEFLGASVDSIGPNPANIATSEIQVDLGSGFVTMPSPTITWPSSQGTLSNIYNGNIIDNGLFDLNYAALPTNPMTIDFGSAVEVFGFRYFGQVSNGSTLLYNHPSQITISGSNDGSNFTPIQTFNPTEPTFISSAIDNYGDWVLDGNGISKYTDLIFS